MDVKLLYSEACPNWRLADSRLREAIEQVGADPTDIRYRIIATPEEAERVGFRGSPTILLDGVDPFARSADPTGLSCRIYRTEAGDDHAPSLAQLADALAHGPAQAD